MKKLLIINLLSLLSFSIFSSNYEVTCYLKDDFDDWNVYVAEDTAHFFDNDTGRDMKFWNVAGENWVYHFSNAFESISFYFNQSALEGTLIIDYPNSDESATEYEMFCKYESNDWI